MRLGRFPTFGGSEFLDHHTKDGLQGGNIYLLENTKNEDLA